VLQLHPSFICDMIDDLHSSVRRGGVRPLLALLASTEIAALVDEASNATAYLHTSAYGQPADGNRWSVLTGTDERARTHMATQEKKTKKG